MKPNTILVIPSIHPSHFLHKSTGGGVGGMSLPLSLEIIATNISLDDNESAR